MWFLSSSGRIELQITKEQAFSGHHQGDCSEDIEALRKVPAIKRQLEAIDQAELSKELREYGAWDADQLEDHDENLSRILWLACGDITERVKSPEMFK
jgi:hypothetical protein